MKTVLIPLPGRDFDPSEVAIPWQALKAAGHRVTFATPDSRVASADDIMLTGRGLDVWGFVPVLSRLIAVGALLRADRRARAAYALLSHDPAFRAPLAWDDIDSAPYDGLLLPGGHRARGMREYLESRTLMRAVADAFARGCAVGAICHGVVLAARSVDHRTGRSVLHGRRTTALTWSLERSARRLGRVVRFWDPHYYRTYPDGALDGTRDGAHPAISMSVEAEVRRALASPDDFLDVPRGVPEYARKTSGLARDTPEDEGPAFVVVDGAYVSARWPGDAHTFARRFIERLEQRAPAALSSARP